MDKTVYFSIAKDVTHGRGYIYSLQYHIVWVTKYRKPIFIGDIEADMKTYLLETLKSLDMTLLAMEIMPNHIHLLVDCKPQLRLSDAMKILIIVVKCVVEHIKYQSECRSPCTYRKKVHGLFR